MTPAGMEAHVTPRGKQVSAEEVNKQNLNAKTTMYVKRALSKDVFVKFDTVSCKKAP